MATGHAAVSSTPTATTKRSRTAAEASSDLQERKEKLDDDVDAILDDIDDVLEDNAEDFVRGFVQKGGE